jgi:hypothetical protein
LSGRACGFGAWPSTGSFGPSSIATDLQASAFDSGTLRNKPLLEGDVARTTLEFTHAEAPTALADDVEAVAIALV